MSPAHTDAERIVELEADNRRLRRLLSQRDAPEELRHRLRNTLALLRAVIRRSAETHSDLSVFAAHLEDRLDAIVRAQALADQHGEVDLHTLLADELLHYGASEGDQVTLSGPGLLFQPRAGQVLGLALHELTVNAVQHGVLGSHRGRVDVAWRVEGVGSEHLLRLVWNESGSKHSAQARRGFGTEVLTRMLAYNLDANTTIELTADGLSCTITIPLPQRVGRLASEPTSDQ